MSLLGRLFGPKIDTLERQGDVPSLIDLTRAEHPPETRVKAIEALGRLGEESAVTAVAELIADDRSEVAAAATGALETLGDAADPALVDQLGTDRWDAALRLITDRGDEGFELLRTAVAEGDDAVHLRALTALIDLTDDDADEARREGLFSTLLGALGDRDPQCRILAATTLGTIGDPRSGKALAAQLKDGEEGVRSACRQALLDLGEPVLPHLLTALEDRNPNARRLGAELLGIVCSGPVDDDRRRPVLEALAEHAGRGPAEVRQAVRAALEAIPAEAVVTDRIRALGDPETGDPDAIREFLEDLAASEALPEALQRRVESALD